MNAKLLALALTLTTLFGGILQGVTLISYDFDGQPGNQTTNPVTIVESNISASPLSRGAGLGTLAVANTFTGSGWDEGSRTPAQNDYFEFSLTPDEGYTMDITGFTTDFIRSSSGPYSVAIFSSIDNYTTAVTNTYNDMLGGWQSLSFNIASPEDFQGLDSQVTFRMYGWNTPTSSGGAAYLGNGAPLNVNGSVSVPEPEFYAISSAMGATLCVVFRRVRNRRSNRLA